MSFRFTVAALLVALSTTAACRTILPATKNAANTAAPDEDFVDATLNPDVVVASQALNDQVIVNADSLVFPASQEAEIRKNWPEGAPIVGGRRSGTEGNNVFGYLRRVVAIERSGDTVVVRTERASLTDVMVGKASVSKGAELSTIIDTTGIDVDAFFPDYPVSDGVAFGGPARDESPRVSVPVIEQAVVLEPSIDPFHLRQQLEIFAIRTPKKSAGKIDFSLSGDLTVGGELTLKPRFRAEVDIGWTGLNFFEVEMGGSTELKTWLEARIEAKISAGSQASDGVSLYEVMKSKPESPAGTKVLARAGPFTGPSILGVPTTFRVSLIADCSAKIYSAFTARAEASIRDDKLKIGFRYEDDKGRLTGSQNLKVGGKVTLTQSGGAEIECGVSPRVSWLVADEAGPYLQVRSSLRASAAYLETCDPKAKKSGRPDSQVEFALTPIVRLQTGGVVDAFKVVDFEVGPLTLMSYEYPPVWSRTYGPWAGRGIGYCVADCQNGTRSGNETDVDCGGSCLPCATGKTCNVNAECKSKLCGDNRCAATACEDKITDLGETDIDCGGGCKPCETGQGCGFDADCASGFCNSITLRCVATSCEDKHTNGRETDLDCGGPCANKCLNGQRCDNGADCDSTSCDGVTGRCVGDSCTDSVLSSRETDIDCGGAFCSARCALDKKCKIHSDCQSNACNATTKRCVASQCLDALKDNAETDVDCAGACAVKCSTGKSCSLGNDCVSSNCNQSTKKCVALGCTDGLLSAGESGVDCGGICPYQCQLGKTCVFDTDCASGTCGGSGGSKVCVASRCQNGVKDGTESDVDCGPGCAKKCGFNKSCGSGTDCVSQICTAGFCSASGCFDRVKNGAETDRDCGGSCALNCALGQGCQADGDCQSAICNQVTHLCVATRCEDGARTAPNETDVDCGGTCPTKCGPHKGCSVAGDCVSTLCNQVLHWCAIDQCDDATKQGNETDIDCGGFCAPINKPAAPNAQCRGGKGCAFGTDCITAVCQVGNVCQLGQCENLVKDGTAANAETDIDCGGALCGANCTPSQHCLADGDCASGFCNNTSTFCAANHCSDGRTDLGETGVDCGQVCGGCPPGQGCASNLDCASGYCGAVSLTCQASHCTDQVADAGETDLDCGGTCGATCDGGRQCSSDSDCLHGCDEPSGVCFYGTPHSCRQVLDAAPGSPSGLYTIAIWETYGAGGYPYGIPRYRDRQIYCDMTTDGGGWTLAWMVSPYGVPRFANYRGTDYGAYYSDQDLWYPPYLGALGHHPKEASNDDWPTVQATYEAPMYLAASLDLRTEWNAPFWSEFRMSSYAHFGSASYAEYNGPIIPKSSLLFPFGTQRGFILAPVGGGAGNYMCFGPDEGVNCPTCLPWASNPNAPSTCTGVANRKVNSGYYYQAPDYETVEMDAALSDFTTVYTDTGTPPYRCEPGYSTCWIGPEGLEGPNQEFGMYQECNTFGCSGILNPGTSQAMWVR